MIHQNVLIVSLAGILFLYFFVKPEIDGITGVILFGFWCASMVWDVYVTFVNRNLISRHERSFLLLFAYKRFPRSTAMVIVICIETACVIVICIETACVIGLPAMIYFEISSVSVAVAYLFAILHIQGVCSNKEFLKKYCCG